MNRRELIKSMAVAPVAGLPVARQPDKPVDDPEAARIPTLPETCEEALRRWDAGHSVWTVEMGGIGPGYEQCIQIMVFEFLRALRNTTLPKESKELEALFDGSLSSDWVRALGPSGAQWGAAKNLAYVLLLRGYRAGVESVPKDRHILTARHFPTLETVT